MKKNHIILLSVIVVGIIVFLSVMPAGNEGRDTLAEKAELFPNLVNELGAIEQVKINKSSLAEPLSVAFVDGHWVLQNKNNYFADEHEFRLLFYPKTLSMKKDFLSMSRNIILPATLKPLHDKFHSLLRMSSIEQTHFSLFKNEIRSYHKLCLADIWDSELIPEITLGAMCRQNKQELNHFLKANGLKKTKITISKIPIR